MKQLNLPLPIRYNLLQLQAKKAWSTNGVCIFSEWISKEIMKNSFRNRRYRLKMNGMDLNRKEEQFMSVTSNLSPSVVS